VARAALEAVCFQTRDLLEAMHGDWEARAKSVLRVDGDTVTNTGTLLNLPGKPASMRGRSVASWYLWRSHELGDE
jgi:hypothetical protein